MGTGISRFLGILAALGLAMPMASADDSAYEVWGSDQSNSVAGVSGPGLFGSFLWIWDSVDIEAQVNGEGDAVPVSCFPEGMGFPSTGPCNLLDVFPAELAEYDADGNPTGNVLADLSGFGRLHGMLADPQNRYINTNIFAPGGGYVGIVDTETKEAIALFRVSGTNVGGGSDVRSVHMSFWNSDGSAILISNLNGKLLERIDVQRNAAGRIKSVAFNREATLSVAKGMMITSSATVFQGENAFGRELIGEITGDYDAEALGDLTPNGECKENGCSTGPDAGDGGRPNNVIICPIPSTRDFAYITMGGGGLIVADTRTTPMTIVGEYGNQVINGAGCGGVQTGDDMWLNAGVSASGAGATWSTFTMYTLDDTAYEGGSNPPNTPAPTMVFADEGNTATGGNMTGLSEPNMTGQIPGTTTRRDAHGVAATVDGGYVHNVDRIQNNVVVFNAEDYTYTEYDLSSADGQGNGMGACMAYSVTDDPGLPLNDAAPDLLEATPDGKYLAIAFRGPVPVSVRHSAQGSCPGVGIVELLDGGASGRLATVLRASNTIDDSVASAPGGHEYTGAEHSDIHGASVVRKAPYQLQTPGDVNGDGITTITDVVCGLLTVQWAQTGMDMAAIPACVADPVLVDINCSDDITVADAQLITTYILTLKLPAAVDEDGNGFADACEAAPM